MDKWRIRDFFEEYTEFDFDKVVESDHKDRIIVDKKKAADKRNDFEETITNEWI